MKRITALLPALLLALSLCACGETDTAPFHVIDTLGVKHYAVICRKDDRLAPLVDSALTDLAAAGTLSADAIRWLGRDAITLSGGAAETEPLEAAEAEVTPRTLIVGVERDRAPMAFYENGILRGMSVDIADDLGRALGWEVAYQPISAGEVETQLASGNIDVALGFDPSAVNAAKYRVGLSYMESEVVLAARSGGATRWRDLENQKVGAMDDPVVTALLQTNEQAARYVTAVTVYNSPSRCVFALDNGWCAAIALDKLMLDRQT